MSCMPLYFPSQLRPTLHCAQRVNSYLCAPSGKPPCRIGQLIIIVCVKKEVQ